MKKISIFLALLSLLGLSLASQAWAQAGGRTAQRMPLHSMYDLKTVETVAGEVVSVGPGSRGVGFQLMLKTDKGTIPVILGPPWFVNRQEIKLAPGDKVEVNGSRVMVDDQPHLMAAWVKKGPQVLKLREDNGLPLWGGRGRRGGQK